MTRDERQRLCIENWKKVNCRGVVVAATGFGKTKTAMDAIYRVLVKNPTVQVVIVVPTILLKKQWEGKLKSRNLPGQVLVLNTAASKPFNCDFLIVDEIHRSAADEMIKMFQNCTPTFLLGLTATYERLDGKEKLLDSYASVCDTITIDEATSNGWLSPYVEYKVVLDVDLSQYDLANVEFLKHFAFFNFDFNLAMSCVTDFWKQQVYAKALNTSLNEVKAHAYAWNRALRFRKTFVANHPKKLEIAQKIIQNRSNSKIITFNSSIANCKAYKNGFVLHSKNTKKQNKKVIDDFTKCQSGILHSAKMANEGLDVPGLSVAIITGFDSSKITKVQRIGRAIRYEEGKTAEIFTLVLRNTIEEKWYANSMQGLDYIEINESELDAILNNQELINKNKITQDKTNINFRF